MGARGGRPASESSQPKKVSAGLSFDKLENCKQDDLLSSLHSDMVHSVLGLLSRAEQARVSLTRDCPDDQIKPVCKYWLILVAQMNSAFNDLDVALYLKANAHLKNVQFPNYAQLTDVATSYIAEALTDVKHVNLNNCRKITDNGLKEILKKVSPTPSLLPSQHGESLITLQCNCVYISNSGIKMIAEMAPNLQSLGLSWIYANDFTPLTKLVSLTELDLSKNSALGTFPQICEFPKLKTLNFQDIKSYYKPFTNVKNTLKIVDISNKHDRNYAFSLLKSLADTNPDLEELYADGNPTASEQQWIEVFSKLPKLKRLSLQRFGFLLNFSVFAPHLQNLQYLDLSHINYVGQDRIGNLFALLPHLEELDVQETFQFCARSIEYVEELQVKYPKAIVRFG